MKLLRLQIQGFMGFSGETELALDGLGLVHIAGVNEDDPANSSNGSGKTTILEALTWGLFGEGLPRPQGNSEQGVRADEVLNDRSGKQCRVAVDLLDENGFWYQVERWRRFKGRGETKQSSGVRMCVEDSEGCPKQCYEALDEKETNRLICQRLGLDRDIWCRGVVFGQQASFNFCEATAKDRTAILTTVMGLEVVDTWLERCRDEKRALTTKLAESGGKLEIARQTLQRVEQERPETQLKQWEGEHAAELGAIDRRLEAMVGEGRQLVHDRDHWQVNNPEIGVPQSPTRPDDRQARAARDAWQAANEGTTRLSAQAQVMLRGISKAQTMVTGGTCPTCLQPVTVQHRQSCVEAAERELGLFKGEECWADAFESERRLRTAMESAEVDLREQAHAYQRANEQAHNAHREASKRAGYLQLMASKIEQAREGWQLENERRCRVAAQSNPFEGLVEQHREKLEGLRSELVALEDEQKGIAEQLDICLWWEKELPRFRTWLFDAVVDTLAAEANRWLQIMSGGVVWVQISTTKQVGKRLKDELDVQVYRWQPDGSVTTRSYRTWSGGEQRRIGLAVDLGLSRLLADRASKAYRFLALDEIDRHLDDQGREGLRRVLDELRREKETLLVISHDPNFQASFDNQITVTKKDGVSTLEARGAREEGGQAA
jgi:DNA repair exonuclease SbcCD ATPase subunit